MSTRVQKGSTVFRPVTKARPRVAESTPSHLSASQDSPPSHHPPESHKILLPVHSDNAPAAAISPPSTILPQVSLQESIAVAIANTIQHGIPIAPPSSRATPPAQTAESRLPFTIEETTASARPSYAKESIVDQIPHNQSKRRSMSESIASKRPRKVRRLVTPAFEGDAELDEGLDPTSVTMATLCEDTGQGRTSSKASQVLDNYFAWKKNNKDKRTRMRLLMEAKKYGRNDDGDVAQVEQPGVEPERISTVDAIPQPSSTQSVSRDASSVEDASGQGFDYSQKISTSRYNVQVRIGPNGETIVDEESLFVDRNAEEDTAEYTHVEESDVTKFVNSATYSKRFRGSRWSAEETQLFYNALSQFGENYELISYVLPGRDRKACKNKFKTEDKKNPQRINYYLNNRKPYDMQTLSRMTGKDFSGPTPEIRAPATLSLRDAQDYLETHQSPPLGQSEGSSSTTVQHTEVVVRDIVQ